ncbi:Zfp704 [Phodopus roborovskii]|uniref:Zfp704 protein n=1 Tax=Phodopus roborovskii TaxID=109678 RepID=A0AAU9YPQ9_PHORO|nr:Zfp704 [Phodopus roborovskii]
MAPSIPSQLLQSYRKALQRSPPSARILLHVSSLNASRPFPGAASRGLHFPSLPAENSWSPSVPSPPILPRVRGGGNQMKTKDREAFHCHRAQWKGLCLSPLSLENSSDVAQAATAGQQVCFSLLPGLSPPPLSPQKKSSEELDMDKVTAAMVLTSLSTSPLVRSPPVRPNEGLSGSWKEGAPSSSSSSGYWSWSAPSDQSNPSTPSPPLSADSFKPFRSPAPPDDGIDEAEASNLLFDEPIPRKRKNSMKVMFKCLWKNCGKVLNTAAGIQKHIRAIHLGRVGESDYSDGEEDFYYTEIKLNMDSVAEGLGGTAPLSPSQSLASPPTFPVPDSSRTEIPCAKTDTKLMTPLSRSAPTTLYLVHTDHAYQATPPVTIPGSAKFTPNGNRFSIPWQSPPVTFTGIPVSPTHHHSAGSGEQRQHAHTVLSSPPRGTVSLRKPRGEGKKCRKVYGMENRDMWCTACRWKKACQRFID